MEQRVLGRSTRGRSIHGYYSSRDAHGGTLIFGGFHGDEPKSVHLARKLIVELKDESSADQPPWLVVPLVNPDGYEKRLRRNARGVDVNRNFPTDDWMPGKRSSRMFGGLRSGSEPETRAVIRAVEEFRPERIITIHSISGGRECNNFDGPGRQLAGMLSRLNSYPVTSTIGYPTPGSFGQWAGQAHGIPTITLELPSLDSQKKCWEDNRAALLRVVQGPSR
jgi:protein MpaA